MCCVHTNTCCVHTHVVHGGIIPLLPHSVVDILCQLIIFYSDHARNNAHRAYPIGMSWWGLEGGDACDACGAHAGGHVTAMMTVVSLNMHNMTSHHLT